MTLIATKPSKAKAAKGPRTAVKASMANAKLPTTNRAQYRQTNEQSLAAAVLAPDVMAILWKDPKAKTLHLKCLREEDQTGWLADSKGTTYPTYEMLYRRTLA
jgi:hypothetical protein